MAERKEMLAVRALDAPHDSSSGDGRLLNSEGRGRLNDLMGAVAYHAVGVGQSIRMRMQLLDGSAE